MIPKKKPGPPPSERGRPCMIRVRKILLARIDAWRDANHDDRDSRPNRAEAMRRLIEQALTAAGL